MREESHLDDMRAAIRGDFERLEQRLGVQELMHVREAEPEPGPEIGAEVVETTEIPVAEARSRSWLARLVAAIPPRQV